MDKIEKYTKKIDVLSQKIEVEKSKIIEKSGIDYVNKAFELIDSRDIKPKRTNANGTRLLGNVGKIYKERYGDYGFKYQMNAEIYVHVLYPALKQSRISALKQVLPELDESYIKFLQVHNGCMLFSESIVLYGFENTDTSLGKFPTIMYDDIVEKNSPVSKQGILIGQVLTNEILIAPNSSQIIIRNPERMTVIDKFQNIGVFLTTIYPKISKHYNQLGVVDNPTFLPKNIITNRLSSSFEEIFY